MTVRGYTFLSSTLRLSLISWFPEGFIPHRDTGADVVFLAKPPFFTGGSRRSNTRTRPRASELPAYTITLIIPHIIIYDTDTDSRRLSVQVSLVKAHCFTLSFHTSVTGQGTSVVRPAVTTRQVDVTAETPTGSRRHRLLHTRRYSWLP